jgi:hypothetical protein
MKKVKFMKNREISKVAAKVGEINENFTELLDQLMELKDKKKLTPEEIECIEQIEEFFTTLSLDGLSIETAFLINSSIKENLEQKEKEKLIDNLREAIEKDPDLTNKKENKKKVSNLKYSLDFKDNAGEKS